MARILRLIFYISIFFSSLPLVAQLATKESSRIKQPLIIADSTIEELSVGDKVPDIEFKMMNYSSKTARLSDFKGKMVLLDFWATWCLSCISVFPKLDSLQNKFKNQLQIILVNSKGTADTETKISQFIKRRETIAGSAFPLAVAVDDNIAVQLFPHEEIPHYGWITPDGYVRAITSSKEVTAQNIQKVLNDEGIQLSKKRDFFPDKISGFNDDIKIDDDLAHYSFFKKGRVDEWYSINRMRTIQIAGKSTIRGIVMKNLPLLEIYQMGIGLKEEYRLFYSDRKRLILEVADSSKLFFANTQVEKETWEKENLYSYDVVIPGSRSGNLYDYVLEDLNRYSGYYGRVEKRKIKCWLLVQTGKNNHLTAVDTQRATSYIEDGKHFLKNASVPLLVTSINLGTKIELPVIDQTNNSSLKVELILDINDPCIENLQKKLNACGLKLLQDERELEMIVISKKNE